MGSISLDMSQRNAAKGNVSLIRFSLRRELFIWADPDEILFIKSADHYVKTLLLHNSVKTWAIRHSTLKELFLLLEGDHFIRLNKFYVINKRWVSYIEETEKIIYLQDGFPIYCEHSISPFILSIFRH